MKVHPAPQGSPEWVAARLGLPTASQFHRIVTPSGKKSGGQNKYAAELLTEWFYQQPASDYQSDAMARGSREEKAAIGWYQWKCSVKVERAGLCLTDDGRAGASPDGLAPDRCCELKAPLAATVFLYWLDGRPEEHWVQRQGQLWVCERERSDLVIYHPIEELRRVVPDRRDDAFIKTLAGEVNAFCDRLDMAKAKLAEAKAEHDEQEAEKNEIPAELTP